MRLLVTGGAGFIGSNFIMYMLSKYAEIEIVNLDLLTYAGNLNNLKDVEYLPNYKFVKGDICDRKLIEDLFAEYLFTGVIHFAAESHVDNAINNPEVFIKTNVTGTFTLLDVARNFWMEKPHKYKEEYKNCKFLHVSTDEVFGTLGESGYFKETSQYSPNSPYSASKAASDMLVRSYVHTYGLYALTTNCSNNFGPKQHHEKLIPTIIRKALNLKQIPIYGNGLNIRDWLYVEDHCRAIDTVFHSGKLGNTYLIGGDNERTNLEIAYLICDILDRLQAERLAGSNYTSFKELITFVSDRPGHDFRYAICSDKIRSELNWKIESDFEESMLKTVSYYIANY